MAKILVIDDARDFCQVLGHFLSRHGFEVLEANQGVSALELLRKEKPDLILCDYRLNDMDGSAVLRSLKERKIDVPVVIVTAQGSIKAAVDVMKIGAVDYLIKPFIPEEVLKVINDALSQKAPQNSSVPEMKGPDSDQSNVIQRSGGNSSDYIFENSEYLRKILMQIDIVAPTDYSVIIYGESGTGKEAIAQEIHKRSKRRHKSFVPIDCGVLTKELANSELFGHEKGSFTGAHQQKLGSFELANLGTIFLDEITNLPYEIQMTLLRVVQERKVRRVGGVQDIDLDVRLIVASNEKLWDASGGGKIREDLFHRFNEFVIHVDPLRFRKDDVVIFALHFLKSANTELNKNIKGFQDDVIKILKNYAWPGNLRELRNVIKRAALLSEEDWIGADALPVELSEGAGEEETYSNQESIPGEAIRRPKPHLSLKTAGIDAEYELIIDTLRKVNFNKSKAAKLLNIDRKTLYYKINQYHELKGKNPE